jgi:hypothetical protein
MVLNEEVDCNYLRGTHLLWLIHTSFYFELSATFFSTCSLTIPDAAKNTKSLQVSKTIAIKEVNP